MRREHTTGSFADEDANPDPFEQFRAWLGEAHAAGLMHPNAMTLFARRAWLLPSSARISARLSKR